MLSDQVEQSGGPIKLDREFVASITLFGVPMSKKRIPHTAAFKVNDRK